MCIVCIINIFINGINILQSRTKMAKRNQEIILPEHFDSMYLLSVESFGKRTGI